MLKNIEKMDGNIMGIVCSLIEKKKGQTIVAINDSIIKLNLTSEIVLN